MPADLTREEIDAMQDRLAVDGDPTHDDMWVLLDYARSEPTRLAAARAEGVREGIEMAVADVVAMSIRDEVDSYEMRDDGGGGYSPTDDERIMLEDFGEGLLSIMQTRLRSLSPAPAEAPTTPTVEGSDGWIEWKGGECPVPPKTFVEVRLRFVEKDVERGPADAFDWTRRDDDHPPIDITAYRIVPPAEASAPVAEGE